MAKITIRFIENRGFVSRAIAWVTGSLFSHVEFGTPQGTWIGAHARGGVQERARNYCQPVREYVYDLPCTKALSDELLRHARSAIGTPYNYRDILGILFHARRVTSPSRVICSQFCTEMLLRVGIRPLNVLPDYCHLITPETLHLSPLLIGHKRK
jgi:hypothetical protein